MINIFTIEIHTYLAQNEAGHHANETISEQNSQKMVKKGGYSD